MPFPLVNFDPFNDTAVLPVFRGLSSLVNMIFWFRELHIFSPFFSSWSFIQLPFLCLAWSSPYWKDGVSVPWSSYFSPFPPSLNTFRLSLLQLVLSHFSFFSLSAFSVCLFFVVVSISVSSYYFSFPPSRTCLSLAANTGASSYLVYFSFYVAFLFLLSSCLLRVVRSC